MQLLHASGALSAMHRLCTFMLAADGQFQHLGNVSKLRRASICELHTMDSHLAAVQAPLLRFWLLRTFASTLQLDICTFALSPVEESTMGNRAVSTSGKESGYPSALEILADLLAIMRTALPKTGDRTTLDESPSSRQGQPIVEPGESFCGLEKAELEGSQHQEAGCAEDIITVGAAVLADALRMFVDDAEWRLQLLQKMAQERQGMLSQQEGWGCAVCTAIPLPCLRLCTVLYHCLDSLLTRHTGL